MTNDELIKWGNTQLYGLAYGGGPVLIDTKEKLALYRELLRRFAELNTLIKEQNSREKIEPV